MADISDSVVLVTGITGYLGSHVAQQLLQEGRKVRGTVRSTSDADRMQELRTVLCPDPLHRLEIVEADLTKEDGWDKAVEGCEFIIHVASPFPNITVNKVKDENDLIIPAKEGTLRVLKAAANQSSIKKFVLTSSTASISGLADFDDSIVCNEEMWTDPENPLVDAYSKSKTLAEKCAWDFVKELPDEKKFDLSVINPTFILGPALLSSHKNATSVQLICDVLNRANPLLPKVSMGCCDVRDVAKAHIKALSCPDAANKRHIVFTKSCWMKEWGDILSNEFKSQGYSISTTQAPYIALWFVSFFNKQVKDVILPRFGKEAKFDNSRMKDVLKIEPTPINETLTEMAYSLIELGIVEKTKKYSNPNSPVIEDKPIDLPVEDVKKTDETESPNNPDKTNEEVQRIDDNKDENDSKEDKKETSDKEDKEEKTEE